MPDALAIDPLVFAARALLALAALGVVPLGLAVTAPSGEPLTAFYTRLRWLVTAAGPALLGALVLPSGALSGALAVLWLLVCVAASIYGLRRFLARGAARFDLPELTVDAGLAYLSVGGAWAVAYRTDMVVLGFTGTQALLTANHFHYAGFGLCVLVGALGRVVDPARPAYRAAAVLAVLAVSLVAIGITISRVVEAVAAWTLVCGVLFTAEGLARAAIASRGAVRALFVVSAISGIVAGSFAAQFASAGFARLDPILLRKMIAFHGAVNAIGFVGAGLLAVRLHQRAAPAG